MYIYPGNIVIKTPFSNIPDLYEQSYSKVLTVQEGRITQQSFDNYTELTLAKDRAVTLRLKLNKANQSGNYLSFSLSDVTTVKMVVTEKTGYSSTGTPVTWEWDFEVENPKSLGLVYRDILVTDTALPGAYWAELQLITGSSIYSFAYLNLYIKSYS